MNATTNLFTPFSSEIPSLATDNAVAAVNDTSNGRPEVLRFHEYPRPILTGGFVALIFMAVFGVLSNAVSIVALLRSSKLLKNATTALVLNLCFTDLLFSALSTPLAATVFWNAGWVYSDGLCVAYGVSRFFNTGASIFTVMAISINRYVIIVKPRLYGHAFTEGNNLLIVTVTWLLTLSLLIWPTAGIWGQFGWDAEIGTCSVVPKDGRSSKAFLFMVAYFVPATSFVICYSRIYWIVRTTQRNLRQYSTNEKSAAFVTRFFAKRQRGGATGEPVSEEKVQRQQRRIAKDWRLLKTVFAIFVAFTLCYLPLLVLKAFRLLDNYPAIQVFAYLTFYFSGCVNPIIYICMSREYRQAYKELWPCAKSAALSESTGSQETSV
ncbi:G-protein coupled receptor moody-like [Dermacentor andersoni]|uniref:G-protein coupled receptor moody-like n=1 Tax=Dermacentor andersoni TaxID=34620 RepID=UPI002155B805|nr:G-protein coupled receptor moody-like [Dermacentor andersoni]